MHPHLVRLSRGRERERDPCPIRGEDEVLRDSVTRQRQAVNPRVAVLVRDHQDVPACIVAEALEIPVRLVHDLPATAERVARDRERVTTFVRRAEEAGRVRLRAVHPRLGAEELQLEIAPAAKEDVAG